MTGEARVRGFWREMDRQAWDRLRAHFHADAVIDWPCTGERFTVEEFVEINRRYPGRWRIEIERLEAAGELVVTAVRVRLAEGDASFHAASFFALEKGKIRRLEEVWGDDGPPPSWRQKLGLGGTIPREQAPTLVVHPNPPIYDHRSRVLILGTMPSPVSRQRRFYYAHPQNRFWRVLSALFGCEIPADPDGRRDFLLERRIALWDVLHACEIAGADDASIRSPVPNDLSPLFEAAPIRAVFTTGQKATALYGRYCAAPGRPAAVYLPSTSPANARLSLEELVDAYRVLLDFL